MSDRRTLKFNTEDEVIAELGWLRRGYRQLGAWSLPQMSWHLVQPIEKYLTVPADLSAKPTDEQAAKQAGFFKRAREPRGFDGIPAPATMQPPADCMDSEINRFIDGLRKLKAYPHDVVEMGPIGPAPFAECRNAHLAHAAHHLSYLIPQSPPRRADLQFNNADEVIADVKKLGKGWNFTAGEWTLPQICWHLNLAMTAGMTPNPGYTDTPEQTAAKPRLHALLAAGKISGAIQAPERAMPPADAGEEAIETFLATLEKFKTHPGPFGPHRLFGVMTDDQMRRVQLIHCAHHLGHLSPATN